MIHCQFNEGTHTLYLSEAPNSPRPHEQCHEVLVLGLEVNGLPLFQEHLLWTLSPIVEDTQWDSQFLKK